PKEPRNVQEPVSVSILVPCFIGFHFCSSRYSDLRAAKTIRGRAVNVCRNRSDEGLSVAIDWTISRRSRDCGYRRRVAADGFLFRGYGRRRLEDYGRRH